MAYRTGILGKKLGMTQVFLANGDVSPVTAVQVAGCVVVDKLTPEKNGYAAVKLGFEEKPLRLVSKPELGTFKKSALPPQRFVKELRLEAADLAKYEVGKPVPSDVLKPLTHVDVSGVSKGKGYQGVMKLHNMPGFKASHGTHEFFRHGGSIGCRLTPGRVHKGKRMTGHMGDDNVTVQNLVLIDIDTEANVLLIQGALPGAKGAYLVIRNSKKREGQKVKMRGVTEVQEKSKNPMKASKAGQGSAKPKAGAAKAKK